MNDRALRPAGTAAPGGLAARLGPALDPPALRDALHGATGRLPVPTAEARGTWDAVHPATRGALLAAAEAELARPAPVLRASDWARTFRDGLRTAYEDPARALRERVALLVLAAVLRDESAPAQAPPGAAPCLDAAADGLMALAETSTWCWAPHDRFTAARRELVPDPAEPFLDLGAAEVASLVAWSDHVLGGRLDRRVPGLRRRLRHEVRARVLEPFRRIGDWHWTGRDGDAHNWNPWIHGAVLTAALLMADHGAERAALVRRAVLGLDHFVAVLPDDGGIDEGVAYWWHGAGRLLEALDLLAAAGGPALDARDLPVLPELVRYPHRVHLGGPWYVNVGDAPARPPAEQPWHVLFRWGRRIADPAVRAHAADRGRARGLVAGPQEGLGRALAGLCDPDWRAALEQPGHGGRPSAAVPEHRAARPAAGTVREHPLPAVRPAARAGERTWAARDVWLPGVQLLIARQAAGTTEGLTVAVKGGHNAERHNHLDVGSYWVALDGTPLVVDAGQPTYTAASFGPDRYRAWPLRSGWHNVPDPGAEQLPGADHRALDVRVERRAAGTVWSAELSAAYPEGLVAGWRRTLRLVRPGAGRPAHVLVEDRPYAPRGPVRLHHVLAGDVTLADGSALVGDGTGRTLRLTWDPRRLTGSLEHRPLDDPLLRGSWGERLTRLTLACDATAEQGRTPAPLLVRIERAEG